MHSFFDFNINVNKQKRDKDEDEDQSSYTISSLIFLIWYIV